MNILFRREVYDGRRYAWLGRVQISQPLPIRIVSWGCIIFIASMAMLLMFGTYTRRVHATGQMMPRCGVLSIGVTQPGIIVARYAEEGLHVHKGDVLFVEDLEANSSTGPTQKQVVSDLDRQKNLLVDQRRLRQRAALIERQAILDQSQFLLRQRRQIGEQLANEEKILPLVQRALERMRGAETLHLVTETQFQSQLYAHVQLLASRAQSQQLLTETESKISDITSKLDRFDTDIAHDLNDFDRQIASIDQQIAENEGRRINVILAPENGILTGVRGYLGEQVVVGMPLVTLLPTDQTLQAELYVSSASIGFLHEKEPTLLRYDAFPYQKFGLYRGYISEITRAPVTSPDRLPQIGADMGQGSRPQDIYRIRVQPDQGYVMTYGVRHPLEVGMTVSADIAIDRRYLWQWMFDPVISVRDTLMTTMIGPR